MMKATGLLLILCLGFVAAGTISSQDNRIVGGSDAVLGQIPYIASLRWTAGNLLCGATIIRSDWVLSAAHCTEGLEDYVITVVVGSILLSSGGASHQSIRVINHPDFTLELLTSDISLIQVGEPFLFGPTVQPVGIGSQYIEGPVAARISGWGVTHHENTVVPDHLQTLETVIISNEECRARHPEFNFFVYDNTICSLNPAGQGMCFGDSGGSLVAGNYLIGIPSWVVPCGQGFPDIHARVSSHYDWIIGHIGPE